MTKRMLLALMILCLSIGLVLILNPMDILDQQKSERPTMIRIGVLPDETEAKLRERYLPLFQHLESAVGLKTELVVPKSYSHLLELFSQNQVDIAYFGGLTFLKAHKQLGAAPMVMRDTDLRFRSYFLARSDRIEKTIHDFKGQRLAFGAKLSTSGHLMPRHFLQTKGIVPETYFSEIKFSGAHDKTGFLVRDGMVDLGVANASIIDSMFSDGQLSKTNVQIIWKTPPYPDYVWAANKGLGAEVRNSLIQAFLQLSPTDEPDTAILNKLHAGGFLPASLDDFQELSTIAESLGML
ncbi:MAG: phosphate/phosphite/phosphonate ABC transporter substrate-binding protein [Rhodospirillales bacterium]|jgi:phosphonate transport system substrate-binding protein|nr:phosphate/phosphite/phosphonate ABC transporter substrate-binding protein [Rhodospirillales bacterium]MBT4040131.1 phosphate/phosphite/phosphonate ABC transporter substrate-binding protein [Rhodospirillales bacterium]MBT4625462.1 phosphate/phosphite/phosphonate ABC transporter substrate-binding protein [Rhodospirillales bacterium]MBT5352100.1 phosphate/phosphite/phosphonate ABC transporter substrate-binding protein [Rhodospirillales bacterium]MBT5521869.1 phosphate/phosphite/phosphonate ABC 